MVCKGGNSLYICTPKTNKGAEDGRFEANGSERDEHSKGLQIERRIGREPVKGI